MVAQYPLDLRKTAEVAVLFAQIHPDQLCPRLYYLQSVFLPAPNIQGQAVKALLASSVLQTLFFCVCVKLDQVTPVSKTTSELINHFMTILPFQKQESL